MGIYSLCLQVDCEFVLKVIIFGNGSIAELVDYYFSIDSEHEVVAFTVDKQFANEKTFMGKPLVPFEEILDIYPPSDYGMFVALGYGKLNKDREKKYIEAKLLNYEFPSYVSSMSAIARNVKIGENCLILENQTIQPFCKIGDNVTLWSGNHIGHHSTISNHTFISSHVVVSGHCLIGERCFLGVNACIRDGITLGNDVFVGMAAQVAKKLQDGAIVMSKPDEIIDDSDRRASVIKRAFFSN